MSQNPNTAEIEREQSYLDFLHERLDPEDEVGHGLCFGRLDRADGSRLYIGRRGLFDGDEPLLLDWRAPAARPFYTATAAAPEGIRRRRRITTRGRTVVALDDELLDPDAADDYGLTGDAALLKAVTAGRGDHLRDIVTTLRAEQDRIVRSEHTGVLVVEGGPGTGKTVVALHRVAYLLYRHRHLATRGVLVVGPNRAFLDYIGQVLPGLGEDCVVSATVADLYPGVTPDLTDPPEVAERKGNAEMAGLIAAAVWSRVTVPATPLDIGFEGHPLRLEPEDCRQAVHAAKRARLPFNQARLVFRREVVEVLARQLAARMEAVVLTDGGEALDGGAVDGSLSAAELKALAAAGVVIDPDDTGPRALLDEDDLAGLRAGLLASPDVHDVVERLWPALTPEGVLDDLFARPPAGEDWLLRRDRGWSAADVPLLDEAAALVGGARATPRAGAIADRAAADRTWTFGHVIVDEAQELSEMAWRLVMRRCPTRSMTVVGDLAQTGAPGGASSWDRVLGPHVGDRHLLERLTVNYRTPAEIMDAAAVLPAVHHPGLTPPTSIRSSGVPPWRLRTTPAALPAVLADLAVAEAPDDGTLAVVTPPAHLAALADALPDTARVLTPDQAKGLEFDVVLIADPARILTDSPRGHNDLYVAMTRATHRLGIVHPGPPPAEISALGVRARPRSPGRG
ncbi:HelD family protein [Actinosynnema sp. CS-041913]|uniref:HelD family protein n=1 Tax=Actinosynnema sp. CS-041913 TaxID=3239917 RepID=UPI003D94BE3F